MTQKLNLWTVAAAALRLPSEYTLKHESQRKHELPGPPGYYAIEHHASWTAPEAKELNFFFWLPRAPHPGGPMVAAAEWNIRVAGYETSLIETSMFMGLSQKILVTHLHPTEPNADILIFANGILRADFETILGGIEIAITS